MILNSPDKPSISPGLDEKEALSSETPLKEVKLTPVDNPIFVCEKDLPEIKRNEIKTIHNVNVFVFLEIDLIICLLILCASVFILETNWHKIYKK